MRWPDVQATYPDQWLVIEALEAHTEGNRRILDHIAVVEVCPDSVTAMQTYRRLHQQHPLREFYFVHTSRASLDIEERRWVGIRRSNAAQVEVEPAVRHRHLDLSPGRN
jgi:hypothetical protein